MDMAPFYETAPQDVVDQPDFLNTVVSGYTTLSPVNLLQFVHRLEHEGDRVREGAIPKGPRTLDIDILMYGNTVGTWALPQGGELTIPHRSMHQRLFVLEPLLALSPKLIDPRDGEPWALKASRLLDQRVKLYET